MLRKLYKLAMVVEVYLVVIMIMDYDQNRQCDSLMNDVFVVEYQVVTVGHSWRVPLWRERDDRNT
jgi:hypothetical protein